MTKQIKFSTIKKAEISEDAKALLLEFASPTSSFETTGTFGEGRKTNDPVQWKVEKIVLKDPSGKNWVDFKYLATQVGEKFELVLKEEEMQLNLWPKTHPIMGCMKDQNRNNADLHEGRKTLEIEINKKASIFSVWWKLGEGIADLFTARQESIRRLEQLWKDYSDDGSETGVINGKNMKEVLGDNWKNDFYNYDTTEKIDQHESKLRRKMVTLIESQKIEITFSKKSIRRISASELDLGSKGLELKIQTNFLMSQLRSLKNIHGGPITDAPFEKISFVFKGDSEQSIYDSLNENQNFELSFVKNKVFLNVDGFVNDIDKTKPKVHMAPGDKSLVIFFETKFAGIITLKENEIEKPNQEDLTDLLDAACSSSASDQDKIAALKKAGEFEGFISSENQTKLTQISQQLSNNRAQLQQALREKIENQLTANNLTINDLSAKDKVLYNKFATKDIVKVDQIKSTEEKLSQIIGTTGAKKTLDNLETQIRKVLSSSDKDEKLRLQKLLRKFIESENTFYHEEKSRAQQLNKELEKSIQKNDLNQNSETPWGKIILVSCVGVGLILIILLVINLSKNSRRRENTVK